MINNEISALKTSHIVGAHHFKGEVGAAGSAEGARPRGLPWEALRSQPKHQFGCFGGSSAWVAPGWVARTSLLPPFPLLLLHLSGHPFAHFFRFF